MKKNFFVLSAVLILFFFPLLIRAADLPVVEGGKPAKLLEGLGTTVDSSNLGSKDVVKSPPVGVPYVIGKIIQIILSFLGVIFLVLMVYGGYLWMTGGGNEEQIAKAKNIMAAAVIGLIIVLAAYAITNTLAGLLAERIGLSQ